jgi:hypothetical protein
MLITGTVMQYEVLCLFWEVDSGGAKKTIPFYGGGDTEICLFSSFLLFKTRYVRYLMAFRCMFFMRIHGVNLIGGSWRT